MKKLFTTLAFIFALAGLALGATGGVSINSQGSSGVCKTVTTGAAVTVLAANKNRTSVTIVADEQINCEQGDAFGTAPATTPTTGAIGTGAGFPILASTYVTINADIAPSETGVALYSVPGDRLDCIAATTNGHVCTWEQVNNN